MGKKLFVSNQITVRICILYFIQKCIKTKYKFITIHKFDWNVETRLNFTLHGYVSSQFFILKKCECHWLIANIICRIINEFDIFMLTNIIVTTYCHDGCNIFF